MEVNIPALGKVILFLPFAFMAHNAEEALLMQSWINKNLLKDLNPVTVPQFVIAVTLFTTLGFIMVFGKSIYKSDKQFLLCMAGFSGMLLLNVFFPHLLGAVIYRTYLPGLYTALAINLPLTVYILYLLRKHLLLSAKEMILSVLGGGLVGMVLVKIFLVVGRMIEIL